MLRMKLDGWCRQEIMKKALNTFNYCRFPFEGHIHNNEIIIRWKHDNGFRYIIILNDDGTFYGFDMDVSTGQRINTNDASVKMLHHVVRKFFEKNGWEYKVPVTVSWIKVSKRNRPIYKMIGIISIAFGIPCMFVFLLLKMWIAALFAFIEFVFGIWTVLIGTGKGKTPVIPLETFLMLVFGEFGGIWVIISIMVFAVLTINSL